MTVDQMIAAQLDVTRRLIESEPSEIVLVRPVAKERTAAGGVARGSSSTTDLDPQTLFFGGVGQDMQRQVTVSGTLVTLRWVLIGLPEADIEEGDRFVHWGRNFRVFEINPDTRWQRKGMVYEHGN